MWRLIDVPAWAEQEKFDGKPIGLLIERSLGTGDVIIGRPVHNPATGRAVGKYLNNAFRVFHVLPIADINRANNRVVAFGGVRRVRDLLFGDHEKNNGNHYPDR